MDDYRPGHRAIQELGVASPLKEAGLTKAEIRKALAQVGIDTAADKADMPAFACLVTRIPYGERITEEKLEMIYAAERYFKDTYGVTGIGEKPEEIKICIDAMQANYLRTLPLHASQEEIERNDDYSIFRYYMVPSYEFLQELRKYGSEVEVLSPESVRAEFAANAECLHSIYKGKESWV